MTENKEPKEKCAHPPATAVSARRVSIAVRTAKGRRKRRRSMFLWARRLRGIWLEKREIPGPDFRFSNHPLITRVNCGGRI